MTVLCGWKTITLGGHMNAKVIVNCQNETTPKQSLCVLIVKEIRLLKSSFIMFRCHSLWATGSSCNLGGRLHIQLRQRKPSLKLFLNALETWNLTWSIPTGVCTYTIIIVHIKWYWTNGGSWHMQFHFANWLSRYN